MKAESAESFCLRNVFGYTGGLRWIAFSKKRQKWLIWSKFVVTRSDRGFLLLSVEYYRQNPSSQYSISLSIPPIRIDTKDFSPNGSLLATQPPSPFSSSELPSELKNPQVMLILVRCLKFGLYNLSLALFFSHDYDFLNSTMDLI